MSPVRWGPVSERLQELQAICYLCGEWKPIGESLTWVNVLACWETYTCIDCLSDPLKEASLRMTGWSKA